MAGDGIGFGMLSSFQTKPPLLTFAVARLEMVFTGPLAPAVGESAVLEEELLMFLHGVVGWLCKPFVRGYPMSNCWEAKYR